MLGHGVECTLHFSGKLVSTPKQVKQRAEHRKNQDWNHPGEFVGRIVPAAEYPESHRDGNNDGDKIKREETFLQRGYRKYDETCLKRQGKDNRYGAGEKESFSFAGNSSASDFGHITSIPRYCYENC